MGYYVSGSVTAVGDEAAVVEFGLRAADLFSELQDASPFPAGNTSLPTRPDWDPVALYLDAAGWEVYERRGQTLEDGRVSYSAQPDKWHKEMETVLHGLASCGFDVSGSFIGEDDMGWAYFTDGGTLKEELLHRVRGSELGALESDAAGFRALADLADQDNHVIAAALRSMVASRASGAESQRPTRGAS